MNKREKDNPSLEDGEFLGDYENENQCESNEASFDDCNYADMLIPDDDDDDMDIIDEVDPFLFSQIEWDDIFSSGLEKFSKKTNIGPPTYEEYDEAKANQKIVGILFRLSNEKMDDNKLEEIIKELEPIHNGKDYSNDYYVIFQSISEMSFQQEKLDTLNTNVDLFKEAVAKAYSSTTEMYKKSRKFYQYIKLESSRASQNIKQVETLGYKSKEFEKQINAIDKYEDKLTNLENRLKSAENGYISNLLSVLGVFSGIIIAFFGGLQFISSVFNNINDVSKYRIVFLGLMVGFIVFNIISVMMIFLGSMIGRDVYRKCKTENCSCVKKCSIMKKIKNKLPFMFAVNMTLLIMLLILFVLWIYSNIFLLPIV